MFKVKATVVDFLGNEDKYPCHFKHKIGDEVILDGEKVIGRICPGLLEPFVNKALVLRVAGPRYIDPSYYYPFYYTCPSVHDESKSIYDGLGFRNVLETRVEPQYHMANLAPKNAYKWPPHPERTVKKDISVLCPDIRTSVLMNLEAFDLSDKGYDYPYFRRQMVILHKVLSKPDIFVDKIIDEFTLEEKEGIYPALGGQIMMQVFVEELELMGYLEIQDKKASVTKRGETKLDDFKASLSMKEREAIGV